MYEMVLSGPISTVIVSEREWPPSDVKVILKVALPDEALVDGVMV